jgi:hypothetical protein
MAGAIAETRQVRASTRMRGKVLKRTTCFMILWSKSVAFTVGGGGQGVYQFGGMAGGARC